MGNKKFMNPFHRVKNPYFDVEEIKKLKEYFAYMTPLWASGIDNPSIADRMAFICFKDSFYEVE